MYAFSFLAFKEATDSKRHQILFYSPSRKYNLATRIQSLESELPTGDPFGLSYAFLSCSLVQATWEAGIAPGFPSISAPTGNDYPHSSRG